ncbi:MAG: molybdopterin molybdotransferase MoeA [Deltaproteobacteria bacterium]|nr:molybdopterin molybdotransferase MoeA [Deltaproteobacteria bacterium]
MFFKVKTSEEVFQILKDFHPTEDEVLSIDKALYRILNKDIIAPEDLPGFPRSSMDGYAVQARDTFGATESLPVLLEVVGEVLMGQPSNVSVRPGQAVRISTGGMLPQGADGVVMLEYCHSLDERNIEVGRAVSPLENVLRFDDDYKAGTVVLRSHHSIRSQDVGILAGLGITEISVFKQPRVAIISTGDEVVPIDQRPLPGQIRDINSYTLNAFCLQQRAEPIMLGLCRDDFKKLRQLVENGLHIADTVWISGGSSVGTRDMTLKVFESFDKMELLVHGISISPGKPTIIARIGQKAVFGLPGHVASAMVVAEVFLSPFLARLSGKKDMTKEALFEVDAELSRNLESASGRDDYVRVRLIEKQERLIAEPIFGKSGLISTLVEAHGLIKIDRNTEGLYQGQHVKVMVFDRV